MGRIKISGSATMEFEPDQCRFNATVSVRSGTSGDTIAKGKYRTEEILRLLNEKAGISIESIVLDDEEMRQSYNTEDGYFFRKSFHFIYPADNRITETVTSLLETLADVEYSYVFELSDRSDKEAVVMSAAVGNAREKAETIAASLGSSITGFDEIKYEYTGDGPNDNAILCCKSALGANAADSLASKLKNPKITISKSVDIIWITE